MNLSLYLAFIFREVAGDLAPYRISRAHNLTESPTTHLANSASSRVLVLVYVIRECRGRTRDLR